VKVDPKRITTTRALLDALDQRGDTPEARTAFDEAVWAARGREGAILVTDLSGFTRQTKRHGILHFLHVFRRCEVLCMPILAAYGGTLMKQEADDLIGFFDGPLDALRAAIAMQEGTRVLNAGLAEDDRVHMCIGLESGPLLRLDDDAYGDPVNVAFKLGEDVAERGEILIGVRAYEAALEAGFDFSRYRLDGPRTAVTGNVGLEHWALTLED
jgi:adenylate cyclase